MLVIRKSHIECGSAKMCLSLNWQSDELLPNGAAMAFKLGQGSLVLSEVLYLALVALWALSSPMWWAECWKVPGAA